MINTYIALFERVKLYFFGKLAKQKKNKKTRKK